MMKLIWRISPLGLLALFCWTGPLFADYTLLLKNGRRITVQRYREEGGKIIVYSLGGEFAIAKDQIESIVRVEKGKGQRAVLPDLPESGTQTGAGQSPGKAIEKMQEEEQGAPPGHLVGGDGEEKKEEHVEIKEKAKTPEERRAEERAKEEKKYQKRVREITGRIKALSDRYAIAIGGSTNFRFKLIRPEESGRLAEDKGGKLSELRNQIFQLKKEREKLIQEMRQKNFESVSLFLE